MNLLVSTLQKSEVRISLRHWFNQAWEREVGAVDHKLQDVVEVSGISSFLPRQSISSNTLTITNHSTANPPVLSLNHINESKPGEP